jgi:hypothetical protein
MDELESRFGGRNFRLFAIALLLRQLSAKAAPGIEQCIARSVLLLSFLAQVLGRYERDDNRRPDPTDKRSQGANDDAANGQSAPAQRSVRFPDVDERNDPKDQSAKGRKAEQDSQQTQDEAPNRQRT